MAFSRCGAPRWIGQTESVLVEHLVVDGSLDARMAKVLTVKQKLIADFLDGDGDCGRNIQAELKQLLGVLTDADELLCDGFGREDEIDRTGRDRSLGHRGKLRRFVLGESDAASAFHGLDADRPVA